MIVNDVPIVMPKVLETQPDVSPRGKVEFVPVMPIGA
jgi:hypothetical protein